MLAQVDFADATPSPEPMPRERGGLAGRMFLPADFPELQLYALLKSRIGGPNGLMTLVLKRPQGDPDAPFKWDFVFVPSDNLKLQILRGAAGIEVWWWGEEVTENDILTYLKSNIERHQAKIAEVIAGLERHTLILNPYVRH